MKTAVLAVLIGTLVLAGAVAACDSTPAVDTSPIPLVTPAPLLAADGTSIPLPPHVADTGTPSQRDRYATQVLAADTLTTRLPAARNACQAMNTGTPPVAAVAATASAASLPPESAGKVVYAGALAYCPAHRGAFDDLATLAHGGLAAPPSVAADRPTTTTTSSSRSTTTTRSTTTKKPTADTRRGCGERAVARGVFNPSCSEYQGYLDPGRAGGRESSSGDLQHDYGCEQGYIPAGEC